MEYYYHKLKDSNYTNEQFEDYIRNPNTKKLFTKKELDELSNMWYGIEKHIEIIEEINNEMLAELASEEKEETEPFILENFDNLNKDELDEYSINTWGIDLDKRFSKKKMIEELKQKLSERE